MPLFRFRALGTSGAATSQDDADPLQAEFEAACLAAVKLDELSADPAPAYAEETESEVPHLCDELAALRAKLVQQDELERSLVEARERVAELEAVQAGRLEEIEMLRSARAVALAAERDAQRAIDVLEKDAANRHCELVALTTAADDAARLGDENSALHARCIELQDRVDAAASRADVAERALRTLEETHRADGLRQAAESAERARAARVMGEKEATSRVAAEIASLKKRADDAEDAVRTALRELGVDPVGRPLTASSVIQAAAPLTLFALGEGTPGWTPSAPDDTLAAAVLYAARKSTRS